MTIDFYKYQGTGNDFIIIDESNVATVPNVALQPETIAKLCDRHYGIGADGLMLFRNKEGYDFEMIYYNADGKLGSMCGNGGRCMIRFASDRGMQREKFHFMASDGEHEGEIKNGIVCLKMQDVDGVEAIGDDHLIDTGSPHYLQSVTGLSTFDVYRGGRGIRHNERFNAEGVNVNFVEQLDERVISVRTFERGVEDETLSCGTGVTAAALRAAYAEGENHIRVKTQGGDLSVNFNKQGESRFDNIYLCGPAGFVFKGSVDIHE